MTWNVARNSIGAEMSVPGIAKLNIQRPFATPKRDARQAAESAGWQVMPGEKEALRQAGA
jgi:phage-related baseplate assembly protein